MCLGSRKEMGRYFSRFFTPLSYEEAKIRFENGEEFVVLYSDGTDALSENYEKWEDFERLYNNGCMFGVEKPAGKLAV